MHLTLPLMALVTDQVSVAMAWEDPSLQPTFAVPDFLDGAPGHRMSLKGNRIQATIRVAEGWNEGGRLEATILWTVERRGLPPLPEPPRSFEEQMQLSLAAYRGMVHDPEHGGWFHAVVPGAPGPRSRGAYLADCASAIWRITGQAPETPSLAYGGSHVNNSAIYFVTGRAAEWLQTVNRRAEALIWTKSSRAVIGALRGFRCELIAEAPRFGASLVLVRRWEQRRLPCSVSTFRSSNRTCGSPRIRLPDKDA